MRAGELLALTLNDIDFRKNQITINKTFYHLTGRDTIQPPKNYNKKNRKRKSAGSEFHDPIGAFRRKVDYSHEQNSTH